MIILQSFNIVKYTSSNNQPSKGLLKNTKDMDT